ncbi:DUF4190 domain-containing protein [Streptomyces sp. ITFR-16]|uniref:DUF4190 domain-containing protein n=1 Tax=Streptomyces sp. ITFR-16 TaxID=3075198 RepID=UPI002889A33C|nr:DUF4190 domain-containing protein [Streptomyces sp. ITFR-16]WNI22319.1 DUF4190 domain-containing protein [Streptomyces sp. ITFR-16]
MTLTAFARRSAPEAATDEPRTATDAAAAATGPAGRTDAGGDSPQSGTRRPTRDADGLAVASFVLGLVGLLVMNVLLGPAAIVMALLALVRSTTRRGRAFLGLALGIADLVILAFLVTGNGVVAWNFGG